MTEEEADEAKNLPEVSFELSDARVVAIFSKGGGYVETAPTLLVSEGRHWCWERPRAHEEPREYLEYQFNFEVPGSEATLSQWAKVVVTGTHVSGAVLQIAGRGMVGYDQRGFAQGLFYKPPKIRVLNDGARADRLKADALAHGAIDRGFEAAPVKH